MIWLLWNSNNIILQKGNSNMAELYGIENIKKIFNIGIGLGMAGAANITAWADGKTDAADFAFVPRLFPLLGDLVNTQFGQIFPEIKDLSKVEIQELFDFFKSHFELENKTIEAVVEEGLAICMNIATMVETIINLVKGLKL
jgi:hypothetical protein